MLARGVSPSYRRANDRIVSSPRSKSSHQVVVRGDAASKIGATGRAHALLSFVCVSS
jgi:hypothetical protein